MKRLIAWIILIALIVVLTACTPLGRALFNKYDSAVQKADDATNYKTRKHVEDTCRSMIASYESDKLTWMQYQVSELPEERQWAANAKMRANKTAVSYNEFILKNKYVWAGNVPSDIRQTLQILE